MTIHKSLVPPSKLRRHRNVLSRAERIDALKKEERWEEARSVFGLPKIRNIMMRAKKKKKAEEAAEGAEGEAAAAAEGAAAPAAAGPKAEAKKEEPKKEKKK